MADDPTKGLDFVHAPVASEWSTGPVYTLIRPGWTNYSQSFHGFNYSVHFDENDTAQVYGPHFERWIGDERARVEGIFVVKPEESE